MTNLKAVIIALTIPVVILGTYPGGPRYALWDVNDCVQQMGCSFYGGNLNLNEQADTLGEITGNHRWN